MAKNTIINNTSALQKTIFFCVSFFISEVKSEIIESTYFDLSLDQLADIEITSAAKKPQKISLTAASVFVLKQDDIKRSGVTTIPDALRMVPGVQVAKLDANKWAISIRGFNDIFSNKLLVLIDGRSVYSPFFGGAYWDTVDTVLEDIERIEVVRGPGGTLWGSNAVNGVINIITKNSKDSQGLFVSALAGNEERGKLSIRYGGKINQQTHYRIFAKGFEKDEGEDGVDDWRMGRVGFRIDSQPSQQDKLSFHSEVYAGEEGERAMSDLDFSPFGTYASKTNVFGAHILFQWQRDLGNGSDLSFQTYYDRTEREHFYITDNRDTVDMDFQHRFKSFWQQEFIWGLGFRYIGDETSAGTVMEMIPDNRSDQIYSAFIQVEHNSYTGFEYQPSARLLWKIFKKHSVWGAVSRAVRIPSRMEQDVVLKRNFFPGPDLALNILGSHDMDSEELIAYEVGYRFLGKKISFDFSFYYNDYDNLRTIEVSDFEPGIIPLVATNGLEGEAYGLEVAANWQVNPSWRLNTGYSYTRLQLHLKQGSIDTTEEGDEGDSPQHQFTFRSLWQISKEWQLDGALRYVDMVKASKSTKKDSVDSYFTIDMRMAWQVNKVVELSLIGQNLLGKHREFRGSTIDTQATDVEPSIFFQADFHYRLF